MLEFQSKRRAFGTPCPVPHAPNSEPLPRHNVRYCVNALLFLLLLFPPQELVIPPPRGLVNDFAGVIDAAHAARIERVAAYVRSRSGGEIAVVTLRDLGGRAANDVATRIGREWRVGADAPIGDRRRNAGLVILVVPKETSADGRGHVFIAPGQGSEGFATDAGVGDIWREAIPELQRREYGAAIERITLRVSELYAREFGFSLDSLDVTLPARAPAPQAPATRDGSGIPGGMIALLVILFVIMPMLSRGQRGRRRYRGGGLGSALPWILMDAMRGSRRSGGGWGGGWGGGGGGGGGGFGGFGGGGGFSGGGSGGSW